MRKIGYSLSKPLSLEEVSSRGVNPDNPSEQEGDKGGETKSELPNCVSDETAGASGHAEWASFRLLFLGRLVILMVG